MKKIEPKLISGDSKDSLVLAITCNCHDPDHVLLIYRDYEFADQLNFEMNIDNIHSFWERLKRAWKYLFRGGYVCLGEILVDSERLSELVDHLNKLKK